MLHPLRLRYPEGTTAVAMAAAYTVRSMLFQLGIEEQIDFPFLLVYSDYKTLT